MGMGELVFDPADQLGAAVPTARTTTKAIWKLQVGTGRFSRRDVTNKEVSRDGPA
jgi:hypothetical protein